MLREVIPDAERALYETLAQPSTVQKEEPGQ